MKKISLVVLIILLLSLFTTSLVSAQTYYFSVDSATMDVYWNADGSLNLTYVYGSLMIHVPHRWILLILVCRMEISAYQTSLPMLMVKQ